MILMCITSLGIFGFLTGAYQIHASTVGSFDTKIAALQSEKQAIDKTIEESAERVKVLTEVRAAQEQRVKESGNYKAPRDQAYKAIAEANEEIQRKENTITSSRERVIAIDKDIAELQITLNTTTDVGSFKFIASALNTDVNTSVQYFIFALIAVFDPLAVALVLCWNKLLEHRAAKKKEDELFLENILNAPAVNEGASVLVLNTVPHKPEPVVVAPAVTAPVKPVVVESPAPVVVDEASIPEDHVVDVTEMIDDVTTPVEETQQPIDEVAVTEAARLEKERIEIANRKRMAGDNNSVIIH
jgi:hypothetical protein